MAQKFTSNDLFTADELTEQKLHERLTRVDLRDDLVNDDDYEDARAEVNAYERRYRHW